MANTSTAATAARNGKKKKTAGKKRGRRSKNGVSKADAIREANTRLGASARNRDIVADLKKRGISVSAAQVSGLRNKTKSKKKATARITAVIASAETVTLEHLLAVKLLVKRLGGIVAARTALAQLEKIVSE